MLWTFPCRKKTRILCKWLILLVSISLDRTCYAFFWKALFRMNNVSSVLVATAIDRPSSWYAGGQWRPALQLFGQQHSWDRGAVRHFAPLFIIYVVLLRIEQNLIWSAWYKGSCSALCSVVCAHEKQARCHLIKQRDGLFCFFPWSYKYIVQVLVVL